LAPEVSEITNTGEFVPGCRWGPGVLKYELRLLRAVSSRFSNFKILADLPGEKIVDLSMSRH
jgi:hypothetical protein